MQQGGVESGDNKRLRLRFENLRDRTRRLAGTKTRAKLATTGDEAWGLQRWSPLEPAGKCEPGTSRAPATGPAQRYRQARPCGAQTR